MVTSAPFSIGSLNIEPDGRREAIKISESEFITISKSRGAFAGISQYELEKYDLTLKSYFKTTIVAKEEEDFKELFYNGKDIILFSVIRSIIKQQTSLVAYGFDAQTGKKIW